MKQGPSRKPAAAQLVNIFLAFILRNYATSRKVAGSIPDEVFGYFQLVQSFQPHCDHGHDSTYNRNEY
jgi:hypothetical protein